MKALSLIAGLVALILLALRVPITARDLGYYLEGACILVAFGMVATDKRP